MTERQDPILPDEDLTTPEHVLHAGAVNGSGPAAEPVDQAAAAAAPCGCAERVDSLEARLARSDRALKVIGQLAIVCGIGVIWLLWVQMSGDKDG
jgi:hypothetical protein